MSQSELLKRVVAFLDEHAIDYMITGSYATSILGSPRSTHDLDIVATLDHSSIPALLRAFPPPDFYLSEHAICDAIDQRRMFDLLETTSGDNVDFWMLTDDPFDASRFSRKVSLEFHGFPIKAPTAEDTILAKLKWTLACGESEKHLNDAINVYELHRNQLDLEYVQKWVPHLGVEALRLMIRSKADRP